MLAIFVLAVALSQGLVGAESSCHTFVDECTTHLDKEAYENLNGLPDAAELKQICPGTQSFLRCLKNMPTDCDDMGDLAPGTDIDELLEIVDMLCDEESIVHKMYIEHAGCISDLVETQGKKCIAGTTKFLESYMEHQKKLGEEIDEGTAMKEKSCITAGLTIYCLTSKTEKTCGEEAASLVGGFFHELEIVQDLCSGTEDTLAEKMKVFMEPIPDPEAYIEELFAKRK